MVAIVAVLMIVVVVKVIATRQAQWNHFPNKYTSYNGLVVQQEDNFYISLKHDALLNKVHRDMEAFESLMKW